MSAEIKMDSSYIVIKGRFKAMATSSYGLFIVFLDNVSKTVEKFDIVSSHFSTLFENNIGMPWNELEDIIIKLKWKGEYATSLTHDIQAGIEDLFQPGTGRTQDIWSNIKKAQINKAVTIFEEILSRPAGDKNIKCEIAIETVMKNEIEDVKRARREREGKDMLNPASDEQVEAPSDKKTDVQLEESAVVLEVSLALSPISGIPIYELKEGDKIMVKITEQTNRGQYFIDLLNATVDNEIVPIQATVVKVSKEGKIFTVLVNIGPGIYGKSIDEDTVKVKKYDPAQDKRKKADTAQVAHEPAAISKTAASININSKKAKSGTFSLVFIFIGAAAILMLAIIVFLFINP